MKKDSLLLVLLLFIVTLVNAQVGIGTTSPDEKLHIENGSIKIVDGTQKIEKVLTTDNDGKATWQYANGNGSQGTTTFITGYFTNSNNTTDIFHLKTPFKTTVHADMYHIKVTGYAYGATAGNRVIDITYVGYSYPPNSSLIYNPQTLITGSSDITAGQYIGSDGYIYLWFKTPRVYYNSFGVSSMFVGNGRILNKGEITVIQSASATL